MDFKTRLKELRKKSGLTQQEFSKAVGIPRSTIAGYETDVAEPDIEKLTLISDFFNVSTDYLVGNTNNPNPKNENSLTDKNKKDIAKQMKELTDSLAAGGDGLMFNGEELDDTTRELLLSLLEKDLETATIANKKFIPKKYR